MRPWIVFLTLAIFAIGVCADTIAQHPGPALLPPPMAIVTPQADELLPTPQLPEVMPDILSEPAATVVLPEASLRWHDPSYWLSPDPWETGLELGINGSSGTSDTLSLRTGGYLKRESRFSKLNMKSSYNRTTKGGTATQNNAQFEARNDWLLDETSPWTLYGTGDVFYDQFQAFEAQVSANTGIGYRFIQDPIIQLIGRMGVGTSREIGGPDDRWVPESLFGFEFNQRLTPTQKFYGKMDYYPEWDEVGEFRLVADAGWQIDLVQPSNLSLKISASDRYDSTPNGMSPHLLNYSVLLLLKL